MFQCLLCGKDLFPNGVDHRNRHGITGLPVQLIVAVDGLRFLKHFVREALQPPALTGRQPADQAAPGKSCALIARGFQRRGNAFADPSASCLALREREVDTVAAAGNIISFLCRFSDLHTIGTLIAVLK